MNEKQTYNEIIIHSIENSEVPIVDHLIEELSELISELCKKKRDRPHSVNGEMADVLFQMDKYLKTYNTTIEDLRSLSIAKSCVKYPEFMETLS
jgi:NTP pyrophosphatase (non-canonical NTP hydrolase)